MHGNDLLDSVILSVKMADTGANEMDGAEYQVP